MSRRLAAVDPLAAVALLAVSLLPAPVQHTPLLADGLTHDDHAPATAVCGSDADCAAYDAITADIL